MATFDQTTKKDFDLEVVLKHFQECNREDNEVNLPCYLQAFYELCRFFKLTGRLFAFVAKDLEHKIQSIEQHLNSTSDHSRHYQTVTSMVEFELRQGMINRSARAPSGSRSLLRLHWALEFILAFMERLVDVGDDVATAHIAWEVYRTTLAPHHPWLTRQVAHVAVYALPAKRELIAVMCAQDAARVAALVRHVLDAAGPVHTHVHQVLERHQLLDVP